MTLKPYIQNILIILIISFASFSHAKTIPDKAKIDGVSDFFMSQILAGDVLAGFSLMAVYLGVDPSGFEERAKKANTNLTQLSSNLGKPLSYALLNQESVGEHFYKVTYLLKYQSAAIVWELNYYQPQQGWKLVDINFNTDIDSLF